MLPLVSSALPSTTTSALSSVGAQNLSSVFGQISDASTVMRQQLPSAVVASGAPAAYFPGTAPWRQAAVNEQRPANAARPTAQAMADPWADPLAEQPANVAAAAAAPRVSVPVALGIPLTTQLTAQVFAQQITTHAARGEPAASKEEGAPQPSTGGKTREVAFGRARGEKAYAYAAVRSTIINARPNVESV